MNGTDSISYCDKGAIYHAAEPYIISRSDISLNSYGFRSVPKHKKYLFRADQTNARNPNHIFPMGDGFGFLLFFSYDFFKNGAPVRKESKPRGPRKKKKYDDSSYTVSSPGKLKTNNKKILKG